MDSGKMRISIYLCDIMFVWRPACGNMPGNICSYALETSLAYSKP